MYISKIVLENVCCFDNLSLEFNSSDASGSWIVFLGDNGVGKTTILRSIAMGLCDETSASALLRELYGDFIRYQAPDEKATIRIEFASHGSSESIWTETSIFKAKSGRVELDQKTSPEKEFPWDRIFACGYGAFRGGYTTLDVVEYSSVDSVYTLFNYGASLQNPELVFSRMIVAELRDRVDRMLKAIDDVLMLPPGSTLLTRQGIMVSGQWIEEVGYGGWGDGHRATLAWLADLFGWIFLYDENMLSNGATGIVLLDEIEQHLHPSWQRRIIGRLHEAFPNIQFIVTSHAPLCVIGTTDLPDHKCDLIVLRPQGDTVQDVATRTTPKGLRADQVLTSYLFGMTTTSDDETKHEVERYADLASKERTPQEDSEFNLIRQSLDAKLGSEETELERTVAVAVHEVLSKNPEASEFTKETLDYELRRKLRELLGGKKAS